MIDADGNKSLTKAEIVDAVKNNKKVIKFLETCGDANLQFLLVPVRLEKALKVLDTSEDGEIDVDEWELGHPARPGEAHRGPAGSRSERRANRDRAAAAADEEFSAEFLNAAREVFCMIDKSTTRATLDERPRSSTAVKSNDQKVIRSSWHQLRQREPARTCWCRRAYERPRWRCWTRTGDGQIDAMEWEERHRGRRCGSQARRPRRPSASSRPTTAAFRKEIEEFSSELPERGPRRRSP